MTRQVKDVATRQAKDVADQLSQLKESVKEESGRALARLEAAPDHVRQGVRRGRDELTHAWQRAGDAARGTEYRVRAAVRERPYVFLAAAFGVGFGLASALGRGWWWRGR